MWTYAIEDLNGEEILGAFYKTDLQKAMFFKHISQTEFRIEKVIKKS